jgi:hypothetical protein
VHTSADPSDCMVVICVCVVVRESLAVQVLYPEAYNGAYASCPDPITFTSYTSMNIYNEPNAYVYQRSARDAPFDRAE